LRQPIGGDFGLSGPILARYLEREDWETDVARFGIDIWMTTIALAEGYRVCQSFLGAKLHDAKDPGADLSAMLQQVAGSVFSLMQEYDSVWPKIHGSEEADLFGFRHDVGLDPIDVNLERMLRTFRAAAQDLPEVWALALRPNTLSAVQALARQRGDLTFHLDDDLWVDIVHEFALAHKAKRLERSHLLKSLTPLYIGRVASFVNEVREFGSEAVEERIEALCMSFERRKPDLTALWTGSEVPSAAKERRVERKVVA